MAFENLKDQFAEAILNLRSQVTESEAYNRFREYYYTLPSRQQHLLKIFAVVVAVLFLLSFPFGNLKESNYNMSNFRERKDITTELSSIDKKKTAVNFSPRAYSQVQLQMELESSLRSVPLKGEQINLKAGTTPRGVFPSKAEVQTYELSLDKLNVRQVARTLKVIENLSDSLLVTGLKTQSDSEDPHYHNLKASITNFSMPEEADSASGKGRGR